MASSVIGNDAAPAAMPDIQRVRGVAAAGFWPAGLPGRKLDRDVAAGARVLPGAPDAVAAAPVLSGLFCPCGAFGSLACGNAPLRMDAFQERSTR